jgi:hypothetical protein
LMAGVWSAMGSSPDATKAGRAPGGRPAFADRWAAG